MKNSVGVVLCLLMVVVFSGSCFSKKESDFSGVEAFVYTELQISAPFSKVPWEKINESIKLQPGFVNKTWLSGSANNSAGGFYAFSSVENAQNFVTGYFPEEAKNFGVAQTTRVFKVKGTVDASRNINSVFFGGRIDKNPGAFVYTELQSDLKTFSNGRWKKVNKRLKDVKGLLCKTWLYGVGTKAPGGFYAFDTLENAKKFTIEDFPKRAKEMNIAFYTRIFDASLTEVASRDMSSPFYN